jgi:hypothetical protein
MKKITLRIYGQEFQFLAPDEEADRFMVAVRAHTAALHAADRAKDVLWDIHPLIDEGRIKTLRVDDVLSAAA